MRFRIRKKVILVIRTTYDPQKGKRVNEIVARIKKDDLALPEEVRSNLNEEEIRETEEWLAAYFEAHRNRAGYAANTLALHMDEATEFFLSNNGKEATLLAEEIRASWRRLRRTLTKVGLITAKKAENESA